jgi:hypothetical protein
MLQRENGTPCKSFITLEQICIVCDTGQLVRRGRNFTVRGFLSDGSETPELSLRPLFEDYHQRPRPSTVAAVNLAPAVPHGCRSGRACLSAWIEHRSGEQRSP